MKLTRTARPAFTVVQETNHFPVISGWVFQDTWIQLADGTIELWSLPLRPLGGVR